MNSNAMIGKLGFVALAVVIVAALSFYFSNLGYGKVSRDAYEVSKALYGSCLAKSEARLDAVEMLLAGETDREIELTMKERRWIESMIVTARKGHWDSASRSARRMMEDQVNY